MFHTAWDGFQKGGAPATPSDIRLMTHSLLHASLSLSYFPRPLSTLVGPLPTSTITLKSLLQELPLVSASQGGTLNCLLYLKESGSYLH